VASEAFANALRRYGEMWGSARRDGRLLTDVVTVTATTARGRMEIPLVGKQRVGYKPGRISSEGSLAFQKVDTGWELDVYNAMTIDVEELRARRDRGEFGTLDGTFDLILSNDDPHAYGKEVWQVTGCQLWQFEIGINAGGDSFIGREIPLTFEEAKPLKTFRVQDGAVQQVHNISA
jgi:hypothetical protein